MKLTAILIAAFAMAASAGAISPVSPGVSQSKLGSVAIATPPTAQADRRKPTAPASACSKARMFFALFSAQPAGSDCDQSRQW